MTRLQARAVEVRHGRRTVVAGVDWEVVSGVAGWVVGDNGDGKSSLLRVLAGLAEPGAGSVAFRGAARPSLAYYHPRMSPPAGMTVEEWLRLMGRFAPPGGLPGPLHPERVSAGQRIGRLSTGEAKRLVLDALLARETGLTVLDEPFDHLSPAAKAVLSELLRRRSGRSVVVIATNQDLPSWADPAAVLQLEGDRAHTARRPRPAFLEAMA